MIGSIIWFALRIVLAVLFYATPIIGFWLASSLAAYLGAPTWMAWTVGALLFPVLPGFWEFYTWAWRDPDKKAWFTPLDRLSLKTFAIGLTFIIALLYLYPQTAFVAVSTRGDWMLDGVRDPRTKIARHYLFAAANGLEWLYRASKKNPYTDYIDAQARKRTEKAQQQLAQQEAAKNSAQNHQSSSGTGDQENISNITDITVKYNHAGDSQQTDSKTAESNTSNLDTCSIATTSDTTDSNDDNDNKEEKAYQDIPNMVALKTFKKGWPWKENSLHPVVAAMPRSAETSISAVAHYIAKREKDPMMRVKALHDWVADRVAYDAVALYSGNFPNQDAQTVFKSRKGVCAGYANLLSALGAANNDKIVVVDGDARDQTGDRLTGTGHAWNAAKVAGKWYLIDVCWDSGFTDRDNGFKKAYRTDYLVPPPEVMIKDHYPDEKTWQLLATPLTLGDFLRQPMLSPAFQSADLTLLTPNRARNEMGSKAVVVIKNPDNAWLMTGLEQNGKQLGDSSNATNSPIARIEQKLPGKGTYRMNIFTNKPESGKYGTYEYVGAVDFVNR